MSLNKCTSAALGPVHPPLGTLIDGHSLELVEVLGVGGYGVVYRAVDTDPLSLTGHLKSYAVKCLISSPNGGSRQRHVHIREIALHQLASVHPGVVTLHRVIEQQNVTYIILDYAPDHDLFTQILRNCRYLGNDGLIKHIFLQLLDAVEYCHMLGIYHRDLKPENVLCFDGGLRVAITDFGLATTEKMSDEFRTGSVYHMSPECQGGEFAPDGYYSPQANDVWSLGVVLLNLATGRNPWKSATATDPTFQAYLHDPQSFLPSVLPISYAANELLLRMLDVNWRTRITLSEVRRAMKHLDTFYCDGVVFEGSMARCPWEAGMDLDSEEDDFVNEADERAGNGWRKKAGVYSVDESSSSSSSSDSEDYGDTSSGDDQAIPDSLTGIPPQSAKSALAPEVTETSHWTRGSDASEIVFANRSNGSSIGAPWADFGSSRATWGCESPMSPSSPIRPRACGYSTDDEFRFDGIGSGNRSSPSIDAYQAEKSEPELQHHALETTAAKKRTGLKLNTHLDALRGGFCSSQDGSSMASIPSGISETMQTAHEYENRSSSSIYYPADSSTLHSSKSSCAPISAPISTDSSTYEDPLSFIYTSDHIAQLLASSKDTDMDSPLKTDVVWQTRPPSHVSDSGISSPSRYSVLSTPESPLDIKLPSPDLGEEFMKDGPSFFNASRGGSCNADICNASMRTGGVRSQYYTFRRSSALSPDEESILGVLGAIAQGPVDDFEAAGSNMWVPEATVESQPTFTVDGDEKLTNSGDACLCSSRVPTESLQQSSPSVLQERLEPQRGLEHESTPMDERRHKDDAKRPTRAKSTRSAALLTAMRFLSRAGSPTPPPPTSDPTTPADKSGSPPTIQKTLSSSQAQTSPTEKRLSKHILPTRNRSPARAGSPVLQARNTGTHLMSRIRPRRATIHIGSIFHRPSGASEHSPIVFSTPTSSLTDRSPSSTPEATIASSSPSTCPPATPPRAFTPAGIPSQDASGKSSPLPSSSNGVSQFIPLSVPVPPVKAGSPPAPARNRRWTVSGWTKGRSTDVCAVNASLDVHQDAQVTRNQRNEGRLLPRQGGSRRRRGWLPNLLVQKVVKMPIGAGKWLGSLSGGGNGVAKNGGVLEAV